MTHPRAVAVGEVTRWPDAWAGRPDMLKRLALARGPGRRVEGHTAGAKAERMAAIAAAGFTSDHEPITAAQVLERARHGISVMLRESSLRPDLVGLLDALKAAPALVSRLMLTCDGSMPAFIEANGFMDHAVRLALDRGVPPIDAYRMATLNAATYYGLDAEGSTPISARSPPADTPTSACCAISPSLGPRWSSPVAASPPIAARCSRACPRCRGSGRSPPRRPG